MSDASGLGVAIAFSAGVVSFLSPCVLPLVPGYLSLVAGKTVSQGGQLAQRLSVLGLSLCFVLGFSAVFMALGASATALGQLLLRFRYETNIAAGIIVIIFGLLIAGALKLPWFERDVRFHGAIPGTGPTSAFLLGVAFAFGWTPCIGPVLGAILTMSAVSSTLQGGILLLAAYSAGLALPFLAAALFARPFLNALKSARRLGRYLQVAAGATMTAMGAAMVSGQLTVFSLWLLRTFPALARIG
ncbi:MAG: cytochrome C biogenesis protein [Betaproteobacteria bacterium RIFCSPLOWO2_12_FULL_66_14]|nr:MAG: cytochrome C biogenesis protein [Betaproteobacteria bacterium RIFCSPLOWO2_12_FULL_66_14]